MLHNIHCKSRRYGRKSIVCSFVFRIFSPPNRMKCVLRSFRQNRKIICGDGVDGWWGGGYYMCRAYPSTIGIYIGTIYSIFMYWFTESNNNTPWGLRDRRVWVCVCMYNNDGTPLGYLITDARPIIIRSIMCVVAVRASAFICIMCTTKKFIVWTFVPTMVSNYPVFFFSL